MRVLFATYAEKTHFLSMVPLAWALRTAGHEVRVASQPALGDVVTGTGLTMVPVGRDHDIHRVLDAFPALKQMVSGDELAPFDKADRPEEESTWEYLREGYRNIVPWAFRLANDPMVEDLTEFCRWWRPDLVVWEPTTYAGAIAA
ncbi:glycosyl transferase, partial [Nocardiopsis sp. MG754419]|nr:glycosyl transferase [Nocardiopsis sp. MG754419]